MGVKDFQASVGELGGHLGYWASIVGFFIVLIISAVLIYEGISGKMPRANGGKMNRTDYVMIGFALIFFAGLCVWFRRWWSGYLDKHKGVAAAAGTLDEIGMIGNALRLGNQ